MTQEQVRKHRRLVTVSRSSAVPRNDLFEEIHHGEVSENPDCGNSRLVGDQEQLRPVAAQSLQARNDSFEKHSLLPAVRVIVRAKGLLDLDEVRLSKSGINTRGHDTDRWADNR